MEKTWTVLTFIGEDSVEAVPTTWIFGNRCYWPPFTQQKILISIKNHETPNTCWPTHEISIFKNGTFDNYLEARQKCRIAECQSDLVSDEDNLKNRKVRNRKAILSSSSEEEHLIDPPPQRKHTSMPSKTIEKKKDVGQSSNSLSSTSSDDIIMKKLVEDFNSFCVQNTRKLNVLTSMATDLIAEMKSLKTMVIAMNASSQLNPSGTQSIFQKLKLPATKMEEISEIEEYLSLEENFNTVVQEVSKVGGNSPFEYVKRVMLQIMNYNTATFYTWHGKNGKLAFKDTRMSQMIVRSSEAFGNKKQIEEALQKFFRRAKERSHSEKAMV